MSKANICRIFSIAMVITVLTAGCGGSKTEPKRSNKAADAKAVSRNKAQKKAGLQATGAKAVSEDVKAKKTTAKKPLSKEKYGRKDPFAPNVTKKQSLSDPTGLNLQGIVADTEAPQAIVNNKIVGVGGTVAGNTIIKINENSVVFNDGTEDFEIRLTSKKNQ